MTNAEILERVKAEIVRFTKYIEWRKPPLWSESAIFMWQNDLDFYQAVEKMLTGQRRVPYKCPVCDGCGTVAQMQMSEGTAPIPLTYLSCHACLGVGIIWNEPIGG